MQEVRGIILEMDNKISEVRDAGVRCALRDGGS